MFYKKHVWQLPICLPGPHKVKRLSSFTEKCTTCPKKDNKPLLHLLADGKPACELDTSIRAHQCSTTAKQERYSVNTMVKVVSLINALSVEAFSFFEVSFLDGSKKPSAEIVLLMSSTIRIFLPVLSIVMFPIALPKCSKCLPTLYG